MLLFDETPERHTHDLGPTVHVALSTPPAEPLSDQETSDGSLSVSGARVQDPVTTSQTGNMVITSSSTGIPQITVATPEGSGRSKTVSSSFIMCQVREVCLEMSVGGAFTVHSQTKAPGPVCRDKYPGMSSIGKGSGWGEFSFLCVFTVLTVLRRTTFVTLVTMLWALETRRRRRCQVVGRCKSSEFTTVVFVTVPAPVTKTPVV